MTRAFITRNEVLQDCLLATAQMVSVKRARNIWRDWVPRLAPVMRRVGTVAPG